MLKKIFLLFSAVGLFLYDGNNSIKVRRILYKSDKVPKEFSGYTIIHASDLHNKSFGKDQKRLINKCIKQNADILVFSGDLVSKYDPKLERSIPFMKKMAELIPVYYVSGNHENYYGGYLHILDRLNNIGVNVIDNKSCVIRRGESCINIAGLKDYSSNREFFKKLITLKKEGTLNLLISHRPELFEKYAEAGYDLVFAGHTHGGQVRLPLVGGIFAPDQGLFPRYSKGIYKKDNSIMYLTGGLGPSSVPFRVFNKPEIVVIKLKKEKA